MQLQKYTEVHVSLEEYGRKSQVASRPSWQKLSNSRSEGKICSMPCENGAMQKA